MSLFLDLILIAVFVITVMSAYKRGFFRSVMSFVSIVASVLVSYTFTPALAAFINEKIMRGHLTSSLADTISSMAKATGDAAEETVYDFAKLLENTQFETIVNKYGANMKDVSLIIDQSTENSYGVIEKIAEAVVSPVASTLSTVLAFVICFVVASILLKIFTSVIGGIFRLPVLRSMDKALGLVFGIISAVLIVFVIAMLAEPCLGALSTIAPKIVSPNLFGNSIILKFFADYNLLSMISGILG